MNGANVFAEPESAQPQAKASPAAEADKRFHTLRAQLALAGGYSLFATDAGHGKPGFVVARWGYSSRTLPDLEAVEAVLERIGGKAV